MKFNIITPKLKLILWVSDLEDVTCYIYFLGKQWMLCYEMLAEMFNINRHEKISLLLSSESSDESVAIILTRDGPGFWWREKGQTSRSIYIDAINWLLKKKPFKDMDQGTEIIVHISVWLRS